MEIIRVRNYSFTYPDGEGSALNNINLSINRGEFVTVCGKSGSGKSTLLRCIKPEIKPHGKQSGEIIISNSGVGIGYVMQNPDNQAVTDTVWHELAFGLENMGMKQNEMRTRVAEIAAYFGIEDWFYKSIDELSGGQKQILNLAAVMVMEPEVLILDEPTSQLDPISSGEFFAVLKKINSELGTTIILSEHRTEEVFPYTDTVVIMDNGEIIAKGAPCEVAKLLLKTGNDMLDAMPAAMRIYAKVDEGEQYPVSVSEARAWLLEYLKDYEIPAAFVTDKKGEKNDVALSVKNAYYRYEKGAPYVLSGLSLEVKKGEIYTILGGNGAGKSTLLLLICGLLKMQSGRIDKKANRVSMLPQNPDTLFVKNTVGDELYDVAEEMKICSDEVKKVIDMMRLGSLTKRNPLDLSGGEKQRLALAKILLLKPDIILLDEPTKGLDAHYKKELAQILRRLKNSRVTIIIVSHDLEFSAELSDRCALLFGGSIVSEGVPREFFGGKKFYTTATGRIFKGIVDNVILADDAIRLLGEIRGGNCDEE